YVHIEIPHGVDGTLNVYDACGQRVARQVVSSVASLQLTVSRWPAGTYHAELLFEGGRMAGRFEVLQ
ncbi:MAG: hypothetical protein R3301_12305, partial [Saprospiraceae bacterium]|nr:hypothetical protein [Saprospiraceae bacterium]